MSERARATVAKHAWVAILATIAVTLVAVPALALPAGAFGDETAVAPTPPEGSSDVPAIPIPEPTASPTPTTTPTPTPTPTPTWTTIGHSVRDRAIKAIVFGSGSFRVLFIGGTHGNEYGTGVAKAFARWLLAHPAQIPDGVQIHIIRCQNPDGLWSWTRGNARGVDLNRNYPTSNWSSRLDPRDPSGMMGLTGGSRPGSEPETRAVLRYLKKGFARVVGLHSTAGLIDWNGTGGRRIARRMSRLCGLPLGHLGYQAYIHGSLGQFFPQRYHHPTITVELRRRGMTVALRRALLAAARP
jgi:murein peptide amidase A